MSTLFSSTSCCWGWGHVRVEPESWLFCSGNCFAVSLVKDLGLVCKLWPLEPPLLGIPVLFVLDVLDDSDAALELVPPRHLLHLLLSVCRVSPLLTWALL